MVIWVAGGRDMRTGGTTDATRELTSVPDRGRRAVEAGYVGADVVVVRGGALGLGDVVTAEVRTALGEERCTVPVAGSVNILREKCYETYMDQLPAALERAASYLKKSRRGGSGQKPVGDPKDITESSSKLNAQNGLLNRAGGCAYLVLL